jgi:hypothetical protein
VVVTVDAIGPLVVAVVVVMTRSVGVAVGGRLVVGWWLIDLNLKGKKKG